MRSMVEGLLRTRATRCGTRLEGDVFEIERTAAPSGSRRFAATPVEGRRGPIAPASSRTRAACARTWSSRPGGAAKCLRWLAKNADKGTMHAPGIAESGLLGDASIGALPSRHARAASRRKRWIALAGVMPVSATKLRAK
jgi:hypothetical protein